MATELQINDPPSEIQKFYAGKTIFVTGASGFLGRLLIEKLLRTCDGLKHIYILLREKKGKLPEERFKDVFDVPVFDRLRAERPDFLSKVSILEGDLVSPYVGLSETSKAIIKEEVNCIYHVGATVRFDEKLKRGAYTNVRSIRDLLRLAREMKHLEAFVYVSTAFSNCIRQDIDEVFYEPIITGEKLLDLVECLDEKVLDAITPTIIQNNPNTYVFTKAVAEEVVKTESKNLPVVIVRPSIVISAYKEPVAGWIDNLYGPTTIFMGSALGLLRTVYGKPENVADLVPVDFVINNIIAVAWDVAQNNNNLVAREIHEKDATQPKIYNYVSGSQNPITWEKFKILSKESALKVPSPLIIWHSTFNIRSNYFIHFMIAFLFQTVPAYVVDFFARCIGKKPMFVDAFKKIDKFCGVISYFILHQWNFRNSNVQNLYKRLNSTDKRLYNFDIASVDWPDFFTSYIVGARLYLLKDPLDTIPQGRRKLIAVRIGHYLLVTVLCLFLYKLFSLIWRLL